MRFSLTYLKRYHLKENAPSSVCENEYINTFLAFENVYLGRQGQVEMRTEVDSQGMKMLFH